MLLGMTQREIARSAVVRAASRPPRRSPDRGWWSPFTSTRSKWRLVAHVVREVLLQQNREVAWSGDQEVVEAFAAQGADPALRYGVRPRCPDRAADDADVGAGEHGAKGGGELAVPVAD